MYVYKDNNQMFVIQIGYKFSKIMDEVQNWRV